MMRIFKTYLLNLNFFQSSDSNQEHEYRSNIIATRIYIIIFGISLSILILALWLTLQTTKIILQYPTEQQFQALPFDAYCPCSRISLSYGQFVSIEARRFHQVCSSDFVTDRWMKTIFYENDAAYLSRADFRVIGSAQFRALSSLCEMTRTSILRSLASFNIMLMISPTILSRLTVISQAQNAIKQFQLTTANTFQNQLDFIRRMIIGNQLVSALETNINPLYLQVFNKSLQLGRYMIYNISNDSYCNCQVNMDCRVPSGIFNDIKDSFINAIFAYNLSMLMKIDGFSAGCMPMDSILQSTLQCFYNQTCLNTILSYLPTNETFTAMNISNNSRFKLTLTIKEIVNELMVEEWYTNISYDKYYSQCAPKMCTYSKVDRHNSIYVLTKVISSLGGLTLVLIYIIPIIVRFIRRKKPNESSPRIPLFIRIHQLQVFIKRFLSELNFFDHSSSTSQQIHYQCIGTRLYVLFLFISLTVLTTCILTTVTVYHETKVNPNEEEFNKLQQYYPSTLSCPCNTLSIPYKTFIQLEPSYHQICSSDMISQRWIDYYNYFQLYLFTSSNDFRANAGLQFQILATFCEQAYQTVNDSLQVFLQRQFVTSQSISQQLFQSQINQSIEQWKIYTLNSFLHSIQLFRLTNQGNQLINSLHNFQFNTHQLIPTPTNYSNCSCARTSTCRTHMSIFIYNSTILEQVEHFRIPNFFIGCFPIESLLESTLECFYDRHCMNTIESYMYNTTPNFSPLNVTRNLPNETIQSILNRLMIDSWILNISFTNYYQICAPSSCTYEYTRQHDIFYLISTILGIFAGLSLGIKILIFISLRFIEKIVEDFSFFTLKKRLRSIFICHHEQQIINRLHFILLLMILSIFYLVSSFTLVTQIEQIMKPSILTYENLVNTYSNSLQCPCSNISIQYQSFLTILPRMHEICSSDFILNEWIDYIYRNTDPPQVNSSDFRRTATGQFQLLASLCNLSQEVVNESLLTLLTSNFIDTQLLSSKLLNVRIQNIIKEFKMTIPNSFLNSLSLIRQTTGVNMLTNMFMTNWQFQSEILLTIFIIFYTKPLDYNGCSCGLSSKCVQPSQGMMVGCYPLEALLQTTFQCFYNQTCIDSTNTYQALNLSSNISINSTIESILDKLMVEDYYLNITYEKYYSECKPLWCSYSYVGYRDRIEVISTVIGLYGGMAVIVKFFVIILTKLWFSRKQNRQIHPQINEDVF